MGWFKVNWSMDRQGDVLRLLGCRITELRKERLLTIRDLAVRAGLEPEDLSAMEAGQVDIPLTVIHRLAGALGINFGEFLNFL